MLNTTLTRLLFLGVLACVASVIFLSFNLPNRWQYALHYRSISYMAIVLSSIAIAVSTFVFQTLANNRILTPSILGLDSLYVLLYTTVVFLFGSQVLMHMGQFWQFVITTALMVLFAFGLYQFMLKEDSPNLYFLLLVGIIFGTFFHSLTLFMEVLIDPNEFQIVQDVNFASINNVNRQILPIAAICIGLPCFYVLRHINTLNVLALGRDNAMTLGIDYAILSKRLLIVVAVLMSAATALIGPIMFLGLLVMNLTFEFMQHQRYQTLIPASILITIIALLGGQFLVSHVFNFSTTITVIINFIGGIYFIYLLLRRNFR
ncbi:iron chelate uptake ABC transporter family permease subunit [Spirabiliibacterium falconis]|uniref:iron chelate uptake ABC transporter family permease subunit n=1 Tax=Spirabiliibacterium falconis TaxID=572023 RepID=UPI001AACE063|nr:iron chelate uptake ABC transporter family permease subunit [Spirabiliibacterium falconis]MBE2893581.1 iron chelate uptake ABC transporter family permease subunit [Spirabiliibacterium falconis]